MATVAAILLAVATFAVRAASAEEASVARQWSEELLAAIRRDLARPTVHARNLYHVAAAMWDAWAAYEADARQVLHQESADPPEDREAARREAVSYAAYRILSARFRSSPGAAASRASFDARMAQLGYDTDFAGTEGTSPAALGNRIAATILAAGLSDGSNEEDNYGNLYYRPVNVPLFPPERGNPDIDNPNRWQPLTIENFVDQSGNLVTRGSLAFLSAEWGAVTPFALSDADRTVYQRDGFDYVVYHDPGPPPYLEGATTDTYKATFEQVVLWSGLLDPAVGSSIDISPASRGSNTLGTNDGHGYAENPRTGRAYAPQVVPAGDYYRVLAEFWADGPASETPPGHWFTIANYVSDHPALEKRLGGRGPVLNDLEWDVTVYLTLGGAMHDAAIAAWGVKGWYDYVRPISAIRYMADRGQGSDPGGPSYHRHGIRLYPGAIEVVTATSAAPGGHHAHLASGIGKIAVFAWRGPDYIEDPDVDTAGVGWILAENWWPYQRPNFVTPPFAGYVSGHSTFSRAAAEVLTRLTGDAFFPGGLGEFHAPQDEFLVFEDGPSVPVTLQWATYYDAADECSLSRIYGGIHPPADDIPGRLIGATVGADAFERAVSYSPQQWRDCGDGILGPGEECDDGNRVDGDCCSRFCELVATGAACDDGDPGTVVDVCQLGACVSTFDVLMNAPCGSEAIPNGVGELIGRSIGAVEKYVRKGRNAAAKGKDRKVRRYRKKALKRLATISRSKRLARAVKREQISAQCKVTIDALVAERRNILRALEF
jgi:cysteine-rich repeat protein